MGGGKKSKMIPLEFGQVTKVNRLNYVCQDLSNVSSLEGILSNTAPGSGK